MLQSRSYCLKLPNTSSHTEVSFTSKLLTSALSKAVLQSLLYTHCCSSRELHVKQRIHSSAATSSLQTIQAEDVQTTQLNGTKRKKLGHWDDCTALSSKQIVPRFKVSNYTLAKQCLLGFQCQPLCFLMFQCLQYIQPTKNKCLKHPRPQ